MSGDGTEGRVLRIAGGSYEVEVGGEVVTCVLGGRVKQEGSERVAVGDRVEVERTAEGTGRITGILPRTSKLARRSPAGEKEQVIAANIDQLAAVFAAARPEPDLRMLDRLLVLAELNGLDAFVVMNKMDLAEDDGTAEEPPTDASADGPPGAGVEGGEEGDAGAGDPGAVIRLYRDVGYDVLPTSAETGTGLDALGARLEGSVSVLAGPSGGGKSSLLNAVVPGLDRRVGEVSERVGRGRHTTVNATLVPLTGDAYAADTPGLQYLELWELAPDELAPAFPEFRPWLGHCKFNDCRHLQEPGCSVLAARERGEIPESRYASYRALLDEAESQRQPWE